MSATTDSYGAIRWNTNYEFYRKRDQTGAIRLTYNEEGNQVKREGRNSRHPPSRLLHSQRPFRQSDRLN